MMEQQQDCIRRNPVMCRYQQQQQQQQQNDYKLDIASSASQGQSSMGKNIQIPTKLQHNHALHHVQIERANTAASMGSGSQETSCTAAATASLVSIAVYLTNDLCLMMDVKRNASAQHIINLIQSDPELALARTSSFGLNCNAQQQQQQPVFALWLVSAQLEIQLRPTHKPLELATKWPRLVNKYCRYLRSNGNDSEPLLYFRRNVFLSRRDEEKIKEPKILELLYAEAKENVLKGRYPCESQARYINLGALQCRIELGVYNPGFHTLNFLRKNRDRFLPHHFDIPLLGRLGLVGGKGSPEARLLEHYKRIPAQAMSVQTANANPRKFIRKYLEFCWNLPCYGAAFFRGQIERPVRGLTSWIINRDMDVLVAINNIGVYIVDNAQCSLLLGLRYSELNWEMAKPSDEGNPDCLPCLFLQFPVRENGERVYKILQVFSRQAMMMDTLISGFAEENRHIEESEDNANANNRPQDNSFMTNLANVGSFTNKLSKLTLATFDDEGRCIGQMGSWSFQ